MSGNSMLDDVNVSVSNTTDPTDGSNLSININLTFKHTSTEDVANMSSTPNETTNAGERKPDFLPPHLQPRADQANSNGTGNAAIQANLNSTTGNMTNTSVQVIIPAPVRQTTRDRTQTQTSTGSQKQLTHTPNNGGKSQNSKQGGTRSSVGSDEKERRKRLGLCAYCGGDSHIVRSCHKLAQAEKYKSSKRASVKPATKFKFNTGAPPPAPKDQAGRAAFSKQWKDVAEGFGRHDDWVKSPEGYGVRQKKMAEEAAGGVVKQKYRTTFKETTAETVDGKLGGVREVKKVEKS